MNEWPNERMYISAAEKQGHDEVAVCSPGLLKTFLDYFHPVIRDFWQRSVSIMLIHYCIVFMQSTLL